MYLIVINRNWVLAAVIHVRVYSHMRYSWLVILKRFRLWSYWAHLHFIWEITTTKCQVSLWLKLMLSWIVGCRYCFILWRCGSSTSLAVNSSFHTYIHHILFTWKYKTCMKLSFRWFIGHRTSFLPSRQNCSLTNARVVKQILLLWFCSYSQINSRF